MKIDLNTSLKNNIHENSLTKMIDNPLENQTLETQIHLFKDDNGNWKTNNHKAINWLCTKIENGQTSTVIDVYGEEE